MTHLVRRAAHRAARLRVAEINLTARTRARLRNRGVDTSVSPKEDMLTGPDLRNYFEVGESALEQIRLGLDAMDGREPRRILDLPSGFGRVLRYLRAAWPGAQITAVDIVPEAVEFCAAHFGARPVVSRNPLWMVDLPQDHFDLLWCGSLLTHFDEPDWTPVLAYFRDRLADGGTLVFSTHGDLSIDLLAGETSSSSEIATWVGDYGMGAKAGQMAMTARALGFAFGHYGDDSGPFGLSVSKPAWVEQKVARTGGLRFVQHVPQGWFGHQDVFTYRRTARR